MIEFFITVVVVVGGTVVAVIGGGVIGLFPNAFQILEYMLDLLLLYWLLFIEVKDVVDDA